MYDKYLTIRYGEDEVLFGQIVVVIFILLLWKVVKWILKNTEKYDQRQQNIKKGAGRND